MNIFEVFYLIRKNNLWAGTRFGGIFRIREENGKYKVENLTEKANLSCARVTDIKEDEEQSIWLSTCNGVYRYQSNENKWQAYNTATGLLDSEVFANFISSEKQTCYSISPSGVTASKFSETNPTPPPLVNITQIRVLGKK